MIAHRLQLRGQPRYHTAFPFKSLAGTLRVQGTYPPRRAGQSHPVSREPRLYKVGLSGSSDRRIVFDSPAERLAPFGMDILTVRHFTRYRYAAPVAFGEHRMMFRPRESFDQHVLAASLNISPKPAALRP